MSEMVERLAAVIAAEIMELTADQRRTFHFPDDANGDTCDRARSAAYTIIEAMRVPTEAMINAGKEFAQDDKTDTSDAWQAMIDEALK